MKALSILNHPAVKFGLWLERKRKAKDFVARVFAERVWLSFAKYAELEEGVIRWLQPDQEKLIPLALELTEEEKAEFLNLLSQARGAERLAFKDVFSVEDMTPVRACHVARRQLTKADVDGLLMAVFKPLE